MREWIDIVNDQSVEPQLLEEKGRLGHLAAVAALAGGAGYNINKAEASPENSDLPQMIYTTDDLHLDTVEPYNPDARPSNASSNTPAPSPTSAPARDSRGDAPEMNDAEGVRLLALTMWGEARSDGPAAMRAVGHVVINRMNSTRKFGRNIKEVVWKRKAFSCWNSNDPNREAMGRIASLPEDHLGRVRFEQAMRIAREIVAGESRDPTGGALFYHTTSISPYWVSDDMEPTATISSHVFYDTDAKA